MNAPGSSLLLPEDEDSQPPPFQRLLYHYIRAVQQQHHIDNPAVLQPLINEVNEAIRPTPTSTSATPEPPAVPL